MPQVQCGREDKDNLSLCGVCTLVSESLKLKVTESDKKKSYCRVSQEPVLGEILVFSCILCSLLPQE